MAANIEQVTELITEGAQGLEKMPIEGVRERADRLGTTDALGYIGGIEPTLNRVGEQLTELGVLVGETSAVSECALGMWVVALAGTERDDAKALLRNGAALVEGDRSTEAAIQGVNAMEAKLGEARDHFEALWKSIGELANMRNQWRDTVVIPLADGAQTVATDAHNLASALRNGTPSA